MQKEIQIENLRGFLDSSLKIAGWFRRAYLILVAGSMGLFVFSGAFLITNSLMSKAYLSLSLNLIGIIILIPILIITHEIFHLIAILILRLKKYYFKYSMRPPMLYFGIESTITRYQYAFIAMFPAVVITPTCIFLGLYLIQYLFLFSTLLFVNSVCSAVDFGFSNFLFQNGYEKMTLSANKATNTVTFNNPEPMNKVG